MTRFIAQFGLIIGSAMLGLAVTTATWTFLRVLMYPKSRWTVADTFEMDRLSQLRAGSKVFSWFEAVVRELLGSPGLRDRELQKLDRQLRLAQEAVPWKATEFLATKRVESLLVALGIYSLDYRHPEFLLIGVVSVLKRAVFPALAEVQDPTAELRKGFLATMRYVPMVEVPIGLGSVSYTHLTLPTITE